MSLISGDEIEDVLMESSGEEVKTMSFRPFTKAERIQQLNDIDKGITRLLQAAGLAIKTLTDYRSFTEPIAEPRDDPRSFTNATNIYLNALHSVDVHLKRQIHGLIESGIVTKDKEAGAGKPDGQEGARGSADRSTSSLDVGWLNSRSDKVDRVMEAELWERSRVFLEDMSRGNYNDRIDMKVDESIKDEDMGF